MASGVIAFDTETTSADPMQAEVVGFSLATRPGRAAYVPLDHDQATAICSAAGWSNTRYPSAKCFAC